MLKRVRELMGCAVGATDGTCGRVHDVYFDDRLWVVRYLAVDTGHWPARPRLLIPLGSVERIRWPRRRVDVALTREQVRTSLGIETPDLHGTRAVIGHAVQAVDGQVGYVEDFLVDDASWVVRYLVVDSRHWWPGKRVMLAAERVRGVSRMEPSVHVDLPRDRIRQAPEYDPARPIDRAYEARLAKHYDHSPKAA